MNTAFELSKYIVTRCVTNTLYITPLHLQKILYFIQKEFLLHEKTAFDDFFESWVYGPVITPVQYFFSSIYGAMPITRQYDYNCNYTNEEYTIINTIIDKYNIYNSWEINDGYHNYPYTNDVISNENIINIF